ncbi:non-ribosomal peptide synthetase [Ruegeria arenilitoris]|uniref:non-ribosomal peptide synthetase n=1 Tax=Ruegeria arenilitoris TaxID=1173585 RepID=UPI001C2C547D|nr:non-ribosomal peptide synthetase [Ruegeria arenilitoris]
MVVPDMSGQSHPLSESQLRFWKGHRLQPDMPIYNMGWRFDLQFDLDPDLFEKAFQGAVHDNEILRTVFREGPYQVVQAMPDDLLDRIDFSQFAEPEASLREHLKSWTQAAFDLEREPLRSQLIKLTDTHWVWALCQHHILCDAQSGALMFDHVSRRYSALMQDEIYRADPLPRFFDRLSPPKSDPIPVATPHPPTAPYGSAAKRRGYSQRIPVPLDADTAQKLDNATERPEFRLFTPDLSKLAIYLTAYLGYLHRVTGDDQITIGLPSHNRLTGQDKMTMGPFVEVLPFSVEISPDEPILDLHAKVKTELSAFLRQAKPGAVSTMDTSAISAVCNYIQAEFPDFAGRPAKVQWLHSGAHDAAHAMRLHITDFRGDGTPQLFLDVHDEILEAVEPKHVQHHFARVLAATLEAPETPLAAVDMAAGAQDQAIAFGPSEPEDLPSTVLEAFAARVAKTPDAFAVCQADKQITYAQLNAQSDQVASYLAALGIARGSSIAVHMPRSTAFVQVVLGILKAGCNFVPIAANTPFARVDQIIRSAEAAAVFVAPQDDRTFPCQILTSATAMSEDPLDVSPPQGSERAYVLFTSGSTGVPKGVEVSHTELSRYIHWAADTFGDSPAPSYAFFSSISFDLTLTSLFAPLISGGTIRVYPERVDPDLAVLDVFAEDTVDVVKLTPSHLALACKQGCPVERIQTLVLGGENLTSQLCRMAAKVLSPSLKLINEYGPTEAVVGAMHHAFDPAADTKASVQIGTPADGVSITVRDAGMNLCPIGVTGEIVIGGRLAEGYLGVPSKTAAKFLDDPKAIQGKVYSSGDIGRINRDGSFDYLGRADQQIKIGGIRFETAEFDRVLRQIPGVNAVHVSFGQPTSDLGSTQQCRTCGLTNAVPGVEFADDDLCGICAEFESYKDRAQAYFRDEPALQSQITRAVETRRGDYGAVMMLSGGKDSTYAAYRLADYTSRVLAVTLDNGYISEQSKTNIQRVVKDLGWDHRYLSTDKMNQIFVDSLKAHSNVCQGCFKALYTLAFRTALSEGAPLVVTGLSRGQFFETRLTPDLFRNAAPTCAQLDDMVTKARKAYHAEDDELSRLLETEDLKDGDFLNRVEVLDIYRYIDVPVSEIYDFLDTRTAWQRPADTGRSTNCLINDAGIYLHKSREGYHNYALPYSWDVRMGHKTRAQALDELNDEIDTQRVEAILEEIGFDEPVTPQNLSVYVAGQGFTEQDVWEALQAHFPRAMLPDSVVVLSDMPLNTNGKVDPSRLPKGRSRRREDADFVAPKNETEQRLASILATALGASRVSVTQDFFDLGVDSLTAIEIAVKANENGMPLPATSLFEYRTIRALAEHADHLPTTTSAEGENEALIDLDDDDLSSITEALN